MTTHRKYERQSSKWDKRLDHACYCTIKVGSFHSMQLMDGLIFVVLIYSLNKHTCVINVVTIKTFYFLIYNAHCVVLNTMCSCGL